MAFLTPYWGLDGMIVFLSLVATAYLFMTRKFKYWQKRGITEIPPVPFFGNFTDCITLKTSPSGFVRNLYEKSKGLPYMGFYIFDKPFFLARDPELVKNILVKDFNVFSDRYSSPDVNDRLGYANVFMMKNPGWKVLRSKLTPIYTSGKIKKMFDLMLEVGDDLDAFLDSKTKDKCGQVMEMKDLCANFTTDMIGTTAFGLRVNSLNNPKTEFRESGRKIFANSPIRALEFISIFFARDMVKYFRSKFFGKEATKFLRNAFWDTIHHRMDSGIKRNDLIDLLIELKKKHENVGDLGGFKFEGDDLVAQAAVFFSGGFETSSTLLSFTLYELALNREVQKTLRSEILEALEESGGKVSYEMAMNLPYLHMVVSETLRKYPPLGFLDRVAGEDYKVPNSNLVLEKGTPVYISMEGMHYDPEYFPDPEKFDPERFSEENKRQRTGLVYFPFGEGPHICIGLRLGLLQSKFGLIQFLRKYEVLPCDKTMIPVVMDPKGLTTSALGGIYLNIRKYAMEAA